ncbi:DUF2726 domain-containing protein [Hyphomicrobium sp. DY-1]|uniref:DUF2726 domain-containing protein n=1 Tax=Hyphomicrobium sp. DY-1 TaxID=3075650 RepID=UPI0039C1AA56
MEALLTTGNPFDRSLGLWLLFLAIAGLVYLGPFRSLRRPRIRRLPTLASDNHVADPKKQLEFVSRVQFETQPLLNKGEFQVLLVLEAVVRDLNSGFRVMAQTSLGEILKPKRQLWSETASDLAYRSINSKRADFVIVNATGHAVLAVEYQGNGHYQGTALMRDAVKREAFRTAGVALVEVPARFEKADVAMQVRQILQRHTRRASVGFH